MPCAEVSGRWTWVIRPATAALDAPITLKHRLTQTHIGVFHMEYQYAKSQWNGIRDQIESINRNESKANRHLLRSDFPLPSFLAGSWYHIDRVGVACLESFYSDYRHRHHLRRPHPYWETWPSRHYWEFHFHLHQRWAVLALLLANWSLPGRDRLHPPLQLYDPNHLYSTTIRSEFIYLLSEYVYIKWNRTWHSSWRYILSLCECPWIEGSTLEAPILSAVTKSLEVRSQKHFFGSSTSVLLTRNQ